MSERKINLEEILNAKNLHSYYYPYGDFKQKMIHDIDCKFCAYEEEVLQAMKEACRQVLELASENAKMIILIDEENDIIEEANIDKESITNTINQVE
jgi:hypothetical protein